MITTFKELLVPKGTRKWGILFVVFQRIFAGRCYHSKKKLLFGKRQVKGSVIVHGMATNIRYTNTWTHTSLYVY